jgi:cation diffusion facilitator family transporter
VASHSSQKVVYVAIACNLLVATGKYITAAITGSSAMLAEAFHSTADTGNEVLLLVGMKRSRRPPDRLHPFGHGKLLYFYSLLVAIYIFAIGGGLAVYEGVTRLLHHEALSVHVAWNYVILAIAALFDSYSWVISYRELSSRYQPGETVWQHIIRSKDPTVFTIFLEDTAALLGIAIAFLGILLGHIFRNPYFDPAASILIGLLLAAISLLLGRESGALLTGESANDARVKRIRDIVCADPDVEELGDLLTMHLGPEQVLLNADIQFRRGLTIQQTEAAIDRIESQIREVEPAVKRIFIEAESLRSSLRRPAA